MKNACVVAVLTLSLAAPRVVRAQVDARTTVNLVNLEVAASAFGKRVLFELGVSLDVMRGAPDHSRSSEWWQQLLLDHDSVASHWNAYGEALYNDGRHRESIAAFQRAMQLGVEQPGEAAMNVARAYAHMGNRKQALRWVERALDLGGPTRASIRDEPAADVNVHARAVAVVW